LKKYRKYSSKIFAIYTCKFQMMIWWLNGLNSHTEFQPDNQKVIALPDYDIFTRELNRMGCNSMHNFRFSVVIEKEEDGYTAFCPELEGCYSQGNIYEEVLENIRDASVSISMIALNQERRFPRQSSST
jgi:hypothetical protein